MNEQKMGGGGTTADNSSNPSPESSSAEYDFMDSSLFNESRTQNPPLVSSENKFSSRIYQEIMQNYENMKSRIVGLEVEKNRIRRYRPGIWLHDLGGRKFDDYEIPKTTTLLLIGPRGSGKSSLVNKVSRVFEDDNFMSDRAQISYNLYARDGSFFLQEYMIPRGSTSFCIYDGRSLSENFMENLRTLRSWMTKGVQHGQMVMRDLDDSDTKMSMKCKARHMQHCLSEKRMVNFVIFVVNGYLVLDSMDSGDTKYCDMITMNFNCPYLSFRDDKPVVVFTHGDKIGVSDRARVRIHLGELLGISPSRQIFDIPDKCDSATDLAIVEMLRYSLEHADRNLPYKHKTLTKDLELWLPKMAIVLLFLLSLFIVKFAANQSKKPREWHKIRHLWLG